MNNKRRNFVGRTFNRLTIIEDLPDRRTDYGNVRMVLYREKMIQQLNDQGAGYSEKHGK